MSNFGELKTEVQTAIGREDSVGEGLADRGLNAGLFTAALLFEPPELFSTETIGISLGGDIENAWFAIASNFPRCYRIDSIWNTTGNNKVYIIPFRKLNVWPTGSSGHILFYAVHGDRIWYAPISTVDTVLYITNFKYPTRLTADETDFPFSTLEDFVLAFGTEFAFACLEEDESVDLWAKVGEKLGVSEAVALKARRMLYQEIAEVTKSANDI